MKKILKTLPGLLETCQSGTAGLALNLNTTWPVKGISKDKSVSWLSYFYNENTYSGKNDGIHIETGSRNFDINYTLSMERVKGVVMCYSGSYCPCVVESLVTLLELHKWWQCMMKFLLNYWSLYYKAHQITALKRFSYCRAAVLAESLEARGYVENEDVVGAAPTGDAPTTSERLTILLPTKVYLVLEVLL